FRSVISLGYILSSISFIFLCFFSIFQRQSLTSTLFPYTTLFRSKAYAFLGALQSLEEHNLELERVAGTSAGAIIASFVAAGYGYADIKRLLDQLNLKQFADPPVLRKIITFIIWEFLYCNLDFY